MRVNFVIIGTSEQPSQHGVHILQNINRCLKTDAPLLVTASCAFPHIRRLSEVDLQQGKFDLFDLTEVFTMHDQYPDAADGLTFHSKKYTPSELRLMFGIAGFNVMFIGDGTAGCWKKHQLSLDAHEVMIAGRKM